MNRPLIEKLIQKHEGRRKEMYLDTAGHPTVGIGWNLDSADSQDICDHFGIALADLKDGKVALTETQIDQVFDYQLTEVISQANSLLPNFPTMPDTVQSVVCDLIFNLGLHGFWQFHATVASLKADDWKGAAANLKDSAWFHQVKSRGTDNVAILEAAHAL